MILYHPAKNERSLSARDSFYSLLFLIWCWAGCSSKLPYVRVFLKKFDRIFFLFLFSKEPTFDLMGRDGWDGEQKCPLIFFIFCGYIDKVYIYLYTKKKLSPTFLWVSKFDVKLGVVIKNFKFTAGTWIFIFWT